MLADISAVAMWQQGTAPPPLLYNGSSTISRVQSQPDCGPLVMPHCSMGETSDSVNRPLSWLTLNALENNIAAQKSTLFTYSF